MANVARLMQSLALSGLVLCSNAFSLESISVERSTPDGVLQNIFIKEKDTWKYVQNTNFFDQSSTKLGEFGIENQKELPKPLKQLEKVSNAIKTVKMTLPKNEHKNKTSGHLPFYQVDGEIVDANHPLYKKTKLAFDALVFNASLRHESGLNLDLSKAPMKQIIIKGKVKASEAYNTSFECKRRENYQLCNLDNYGLLFLPKSK